MVHDSYWAGSAAGHVFKTRVLPVANTLAHLQPLMDTGGAKRLSA